MEIIGIVMLVLLLLIVIYFIINSFKKETKLTEMSDGKILQTIKADKLKNANNSSNFTYSMWIFVDDWNYNFGTKKTILDRSGSPTVILGDKPNTLLINVKYYATGKGDDTNVIGAPSGASTTTQNAATIAACESCNAGYTCACDACAKGVPDTASDIAAASALEAVNSSEMDESGGSNACMVENVPIQKWVNITISLYGRTLDVYMDGKLVRTCVLPGVARVNNSADISVTPNGGFAGWTTAFKYLSKASNPQEVYNIYKDGFGDSILGSLLNKYRLQFTVLVDNVEVAGVQI